MTEPLDLDAIRARVPWHYPATWTVEPAPVGDEHLVLYATDDPRAGLVATVPDYGYALAEFIAHARTDVPALLAEVERLTAELARSEDERRWNRRSCDLANAEARAMRPVVEAAVAYHATGKMADYRALTAAVDAYTAGHVEVPPTPTTDAEIEALPRLELADWERKLIDAQAGARQPQPRLTDLATVIGYVWTDPASGQQHTLAPEDVTVVVRAAQDAASGRTDPAEGDATHEAAPDAQRAAGAGGRFHPLFYRDTNGVQLTVSHQGDDGVAFVAALHRDAAEPYEQYGVVLPWDMCRELATRLLADNRSRLVDLATVTGYVWTDPKLGTQVLAPDEVAVVVRATQGTTPTKPIGIPHSVTEPSEGLTPDPTTNQAGSRPHVQRKDPRGASEGTS